MDTIIETDATMVRVKQRPKRNKKILLWSVVICLVVIIFCIWLMLNTFHKSAKYDSKQAQSGYRLWKKPVYSNTNNDHNRHRGTINDVQKKWFEICSTTTWFTGGITIVGENGIGSAMNQLAHPSDMFVDDQNAIYIADSLNHRIVKWDEGALEGRIVAGGNGQGNQTNQLNYPTAVYIDKKNNIYVADNENNRIQKWLPNRTSGETIIGKFGRGNHLYQINDCRGLYVDNKDNVYVAERSNDRITKWSPEAMFGQIVVNVTAPINVYVHEKTGDIYILSYAVNFIKHFTANGSFIDYIREDFVKGSHDATNFTTTSSKDFNVFMVDSKLYQTLQRRIGNNYNMKIIASDSSLPEYKQNNFDEPVKIQFDARGNLLVLDFNNHRVQNFSKERTTCGTSYSRLNQVRYSTRPTHHKHRPYSNFIESSKNQKDAKEVSIPNDEDLPRNDIFYPDPLFGKPMQEPEDTDIRRPLNEYSIGNNKFFSDYSIRNSEMSSFRGGGGRRKG